MVAAFGVKNVKGYRRLLATVTAVAAAVRVVYFFILGFIEPFIFDVNNTLSRYIPRRDRARIGRVPASVPIHLYKNVAVHAVRRCHNNIPRAFERLPSASRGVHKNHYR